MSLPTDSADRYPPTDRTTLDRIAQRAVYDHETVHAILDAGLVCHVGVAVEGRPFVLPMIYARDGERLLLHGSVASRLLAHLRAGGEICVTVTHVDGVVLARSGFSSSMNYRSVVAFGTARPLVDPAEKARALDLVIEHLVPGRSADSRKTTRKELAATEVLEMPLTEVSAKVRTGPPHDPAKDVDLPIWAGVLPLRTVSGAPEPAPDLPAGVEAPAYVRGWRR